MDRARRRPRPDAEAAATREDSHPELARGRASVVLDLGDGTVLRRCLSPGLDVSREAALMAHAARHGVPVPAVHSASGADLVMDLVPGPTMLDDVVAHPGRARDHGRLLAQLHRTLDGVPPQEGGQGTGGLLHLDLHPGNVILGPDGPVLIDWSNATWGDRALDMATTWLVLATMAPPEPWPELETVRAEMLEGLLDVVDRQAATAALGPAADLRLADPATSPDERAAIRHLLEP